MFVAVFSVGCLLLVRLKTATLPSRPQLTGLLPIGLQARSKLNSPPCCVRVPSMLLK